MLQDEELESVTNREETVSLLEASYLKGNYSSSVQICYALKEELDNSKMNASDYELSCIMNTNTVVLRSVLWIRDGGCDKTWHDIMESFVALNNEYRILQTLNRIELKHYLNAVHNAVWWVWWHPDNLHVETAIHFAVNCFRKVLERCGRSMWSCYSDSSDTVSLLMQETAHSMSKLSRDLELQLVDIMILIMLMLAEQELGRETRVRCIDTAHTLLGRKQQITMLKAGHEKTWHCSLKLGLTQLNTTVETCDAEASFTLLKLCCCVFYIKTEQYGACLEYLGAPYSADFVENYIRVLACYLSGDLDTALLLVSAVDTTTVSSHWHILCGLVLSKAGRHNDALVQLFKALRDELLPVALHYIAKEYEVLYKACPPGALSSSLQGAHLDTLQHLVQILEENNISAKLFCIRLRILKIVHENPTVTLPEALYLLGRALATSGKMSAACEVYTKLLALNCTSVALHDAAALHIMCGRLDEAEAICRRAVSYYVVQGHGLLSLEDDIIALMLLACVYKLQGQHIHQADTLDRCLRIINNLKRQKQELMNLLNVLAAKLHAEKAHNYMERSPLFRKDAVYEMKQAVLCNPEDGDVQNSYNLLEPQTSHKVNLNVAGEDCSKIALTYLMQLQYGNTQLG